MTTLQTIVLVGHTLIAILIVVLVLLQRGKGADAGAAFGAGASGTVFGARGSTSFFSRATAILATTFFATSLGLAYLSSQRDEGPTSIVESIETTDEVATDEAAVEDDLPTLEPLPGEEQEPVMPELESTDNEDEPQ